MNTEIKGQRIIIDDVSELWAVFNILLDDQRKWIVLGPCWLHRGWTEQCITDIQRFEKHKAWMLGDIEDTEGY